MGRHVWLFSAAWKAFYSYLLEWHQPAFFNKQHTLVGHLCHDPGVFVGGSGGSDFHDRDSAPNFFLCPTQATKEAILNARTSVKRKEAPHGDNPAL